MVFKIGRYYRHTGGGMLAVRGQVHTTMWGHCLVAEDEQGNLRPVGRDEVSTTNYHQILKAEWDLHFEDLNKPEESKNVG